MGRKNLVVTSEPTEVQILLSKAQSCKYQPIESVLNDPSQNSDRYVLQLQPQAIQ